MTPTPPDITREQCIEWLERERQRRYEAGSVLGQLQYFDAILTFLRPSAINAAAPAWQSLPNDVEEALVIAAQALEDVCKDWSSERQPANRAYVAILRAIVDPENQPNQWGIAVCNAAAPRDASEGYPHLVYCNADHRKPLGCDMCSCYRELTCLVRPVRLSAASSSAAPKEGEAMRALTMLMHTPAVIDVMNPSGEEHLGRCECGWCLGKRALAARLPIAPNTGEPPRSTWGVALPKITVGHLQDYSGAIALIEPNGADGWEWNQSAVDFACMLQGVRLDQINSSRADGWQPIESAPRDRELVLLFKGGHTACRARWVDRKKERAKGKSNVDGYWEWPDGSEGGTDFAHDQSIDGWLELPAPYVAAKEGV